MPIMNEKRIKELCIKPTGFYKHGEKKFWTHATQEEIDVINRSNGADFFPEKKIELTQEGFAEAIVNWKPLIGRNVLKYVDNAGEHHDLMVNQRLLSLEDAFGNRPAGDKAKRPIISYGLNNFVYMARLSDKLYQDRETECVFDPVTDNVRVEDNWRASHYFMLGAGEVLFGETIEDFTIWPTPSNGSIVVSQISLADNYVEAGLILTCAPVSNYDSGPLKFTLFNPTKRSVRLYVNEGIVGIVFDENDKP